MRKPPVVISLLLLSLIAVFISSEAEGILTSSGHTYYAIVKGNQFTSRWEGLMGSLTGVSGEESAEPVGVITMNSPGSVIFTLLDGRNFLDGSHYLMAFSENVTFNLTKLENITESDLEENGIFNATNFPIFHPNYYENSDNPKNTFCCSNVTIFIGGQPFTAFGVQLYQNVSFYLLKYKLNSTTTLPIFFTPLEKYECYNGTTCNFEMILPVDKTYYLYIITKEIPIKFDVWIDGVKTTHFSKTALAYNVTLRATELYTGFPASNETVAIMEENGNNIFIPKPLSGLIGRGVSLAKTDSDGYAEFIIAPTEYPTSSEYSISVGVRSKGEILKKANLTVDDSGSIEKQSKYPTQSTSLLDNIKVAINSMNPIINSLYKWANVQKKAWKYEITFYTDGTYTIKNMTDGLYYSSATLKTGAPNYLRIYIKEPGGGSSYAYGKLSESGGYLLFNPTLNASEITPKTRVDELFEIKDGDEVIITPTSYGDAHSTVYIKFYDVVGHELGNITFNIDRNLNYNGGSYFEDDALKTQINSMNAVGYNLYWSLNH